MTTEAQKTITIDPPYDQFIDHLAKERDGRTISNSSEVHALSILRAAFRYAEKYVKIFSGSLLSSVYNDETLVQELKRFINDKNGRVQILIQNPASVVSSIENKFISEALNNCGETSPICIREVLEQHPLKRAKEHFLVSDDRMYRIEIDIEKAVGVASFNDSERAKRLSNIFDSYWDKNTKKYSLAAV